MQLQYNIFKLELMEEYYFIFAYSMNMRFNTVKDVTELQRRTCKFPWNYAH